MSVLRWFTMFVEGLYGWEPMQRAYMWKRRDEILELVWFIEENCSVVVHSDDSDVRRKELEGEVV